VFPGNPWDCRGSASLLRKARGGGSTIRQRRPGSLSGPPRRSRKDKCDIIFALTFLAALAIYKGHRVIGLALSFASIAMLVALLAHHATSTLALCLLQRGGLIAAGLGFLLNLRFGLHPAHYGVALAGSVTGAAISMRQILVHIAPGDPGFGSAVLGLHMYTWAFVAFVCLMIAIGVLLQLKTQRQEAAGEPARSTLASVVMISFSLVIAANLVFTLLECGFTQCPDDPAGYMWLDWLRSTP
jgi:disulfide bond formation protein DsbB